MKKILFLPEPHSTLSNRLGVQLEAEGFCVDHPKGEMAQWAETVRLLQPDVILMEVMPETYTERYQLNHQLKQDSVTENIPVLLLGHASADSAEDGIHYLLEGLYAGANDYLRGDYDFAELLGKINTALRLRTSMEKNKVLADQLNEVNEELYQRNIQIEKELYIARQLQQSLLPAATIAVDPENEDAPMFTKIHYQDEKLRISGIYLPCDALGGDLYDVLKFRDNAIGVSITDVSGHGVPAGFITAIFKTSLYRITHQEHDPAQVLFHLNNELFDIVKTGDYVTSIYMRIDMETMKLECAGAGHPYPFYYNAAENRISRLQENGTPLVWVRDIPYPKETIQLQPGDKLFLFTDGVSELRNPAEEMYGEERIEQLFQQTIDNQIPFFTDVIISDLSDFTEGAPLMDDISMVLIEAL